VNLVAGWAMSSGHRLFCFGQFGLPATYDHPQQHEGRKAGVSNPGDQRDGTAGTFEQTRTAHEAAWQVFAANRAESG